LDVMAGLIQRERK